MTTTMLMHGYYDEQSENIQNISTDNAEYNMVGDDVQEQNPRDEVFIKTCDCSAIDDFVLILEILFSDYLFSFHSQRIIYFKYECTYWILDFCKVSLYLY